jgi:hypothetical protein
MANVYYSYSKNRSGVLRAVLSSEGGKGLLSRLSARFVGQEFPTGHDSKGDFAILRVFEEEGHKEYHPGFYVLDGDLERIEQAVQHSLAPDIAN